MYASFKILNINWKLMVRVKMNKDRAYEESGEYPVWPVRWGVE